MNVIVDATISRAAPSTRNNAKARDPEVHQTRKGNPWYVGNCSCVVIKRPFGHQKVRFKGPHRFRRCSRYRICR